MPNCSQIAGFTTASIDPGLGGRRQGYARGVNDEELIAAIRDNSDLDDPEEVERAAHATLTVLGLRLAGSEPLDLGSQQPTSLGRSLAAVGEGEQFSLDEFYDRVGRLEGIEHDEARRHARAVMAGVRAAVDDNEWENMLASLPTEYADLVSAGPIQ
jgi:uncharacterized protein (DUF2267 family)